MEQLTRGYGEGTAFVQSIICEITAVPLSLLLPLAEVMVYPLAPAAALSQPVWLPDRQVVAPSALTTPTLFMFCAE